MGLNSSLRLPAPHLNGKHVVFGKVIEGLDMFMTLNEVTDPNDRPIHSVILWMMVSQKKQMLKKICLSGNRVVHLYRMRRLGPT